jgi:hypothetical protein
MAVALDYSFRWTVSYETQAKTSAGAMSRFFTLFAQFQQWVFIRPLPMEAP